MPIEASNKINENPEAFMNFLKENGFPIEQVKVCVPGSRYSRDELQIAFNLVCDASNWKNPIKRQWIDREQKDLISEAITFFTGTEMKVHSESCKLLISAPGYYAGPCN